MVPTVLWWRCKRKAWMYFRTRSISKPLQYALPTRTAWVTKVELLFQFTGFVIFA